MRKKDKLSKHTIDAKEKYFYSRWWFWLIIGVLIFGNFQLLFIKDNNHLSHILTIISGWISGVATIFIGVIATRQNKKYKHDIDDYNMKQKEIIENQYNFEVFKDIITRRNKMILEIKNELDYFCNRFNFMNVSALLIEINLKNFNLTSDNSLEEIPQMKQLYRYATDIVISYTKIIQMIKNDWFSTEKNDNLVKALESYYTKYIMLLQSISYANISKIIKNINKTMEEVSFNLIQKKIEYTTFLDVDLNMVLLQHNHDLDFIKKHYSYIKEKNNG